MPVSALRRPDINVNQLQAFAFVLVPDAHVPQASNFYYYSIMQAEVRINNKEE